MKNLKSFEEFLNENSVNEVLTTDELESRARDITFLIRQHTRGTKGKHSDKQIIDFMKKYQKGLYQKLTTTQKDEILDILKKNLNESVVNEADVPVSELKKIDKLRKLAKKYGMKDIKNPQEWVKKNWDDEDGIVTSAIFLHPDDNNDKGLVQVYYEEGEPEELGVSYYAWGSSGNDSIDSWTIEDPWKENFSEGA